MQVLTDQEMQQVIDAAPEGLARAIEAAVLEKFEVVTWTPAGFCDDGEPLYRLKETK